jgi:hypothetical protein
MQNFTVTFAAATMADLLQSVAIFMSNTGGNSSPVAGVSGGTMPTPGNDDQDDDNGAPDANAPALDSTGLPHDERIHAKDKQRNGDGTWRMRRNVVKTLGQPEIDRITAELRARSATAPAPAPMAAPPAMQQPSPMQAAVDAAHGMPTPAPMAAPQPMQAQTIAPALAPPGMGFTAPAPQPAGMQFGEFMPKFSAALQAGKFTQADLPGWYQQWGISDIGQLATDPTRLLQFHDWLAQAGRI